MTQRKKERKSHSKEETRPKTANVAHMVPSSTSPSNPHSFINFPKKEKGHLPPALANRTCARCTSHKLWAQNHFISRQLHATDTYMCVRWRKGVLDRTFPSLLNFSEIYINSSYTHCPSVSSSKKSQGSKHRFSLSSKHGLLFHYPSSQPLDPAVAAAPASDVGAAALPHPRPEGRRGGGVRRGAGAGASSVLLPAGEQPPGVALGYRRHCPLLLLPIIIILIPSTPPHKT